MDDLNGDNYKYGRNNETKNTDKMEINHDNTSSSYYSYKY